jgi:hypothetical protein
MKRKSTQGANVNTFKKIKAKEDFNWLINFYFSRLSGVEEEVVACPGMCCKCSNQSLGVPCCLDSILTDYVIAFLVQMSSFLRVSTVPVFM